MSSYAEIELEIVRAAEQAGIVREANSASRAMVMQSKLNDLIDSITFSERDALQEAVGNLGAAMIELCAIEDINFVDCLYRVHKEQA